MLLLDLLSVKQSRKILQHVGSIQWMDRLDPIILVGKKFLERPAVERFSHGVGVQQFCAVKVGAPDKVLRRVNQVGKQLSRRRLN